MAGLRSAFLRHSAPSCARYQPLSWNVQSREWSSKGVGLRPQGGQQCSGLSKAAHLREKRSERVAAVKELRHLLGGGFSREEGD